ncbi:MAG: MBL fold metallo-hydrolase [Chloroflexota bacterium]
MSNRLLTFVVLLIVLGMLFVVLPLLFFVVAAVIVGAISLGIWINGGKQDTSKSLPKSIDGPAFRTYEAVVPESPLKLLHFISQPEELNLSSSLIMGDEEIICVTAQATKSSAQRLADEIEKTGRTLTYVYLDHPHYDHSQGASVLIKRFPNALFVAEPKVAKLQQLRMRVNDNLAKSDFGDNATDPAIPFQPLDTDKLMLEGREIQLWHGYYGDVGVGLPDEPHTVIYIPDLKALLPTDICYFGAHLMMGGTTPASRTKWKSQIREWMKMDLQVVIPGHIVRSWSDKMTPMGVLEHSLTYIEAYDEALAESGTPAELIAKMLAKYPELGHVNALHTGALIEFREMHRLLSNPRIDKLVSFFPKSLTNWANQKLFDSMQKAGNLAPN